MYCAVGLNGEKACTLGEPLAVMVKLLVLASLKRLDWQVRSETVPALTVVVRGVVGTV